MPEIKDYEGKKKSPMGQNQKAKRRPHHEIEVGAEEINEQTADILDESPAAMAEAAEVMAESDAINTEAQNEGMKASHQDVYAAEDLAAAEMISEGAPAEETPKKIHLDFYGSELIREKAPKVMDLADTVADEWVKDGQFEGLPVGHPLAQVAAAKVLRKAKDVEKKLEEKGVFTMAKMGAEYVKAEIAKRKKH